MATKWHSDPRVRALMGIQHLQALEQIVGEPGVMGEWQRLLESAEETRQAGLGTLLFMAEFYQTPAVWEGLTLAPSPDGAVPVAPDQLTQIQSTLAQLSLRMREMDDLMLELMDRQDAFVPPIIAPPAEKAETPVEAPTMTVEEPTPVHVPPSPFPAYTPSEEAVAALRERTEEAQRQLLAPSSSLLVEQGQKSVSPSNQEPGAKSQELPFREPAVEAEPAGRRPSPAAGHHDGGRADHDREEGVVDAEESVGATTGGRVRLKGPGRLKVVQKFVAIDQRGLQRNLYRVASKEGTTCYRCGQLLPVDALVTRGKQGSPLCRECRPFRIPQEEKSGALR